MKISLKWLKNYVDFELTPEALAQRITDVGLEVENIEYLGKKYDKFVVGKVLKVNKHPNADKLTLCDVNVGSDILKIVCGAPNVAENQNVVVGLVGAVVPKNQHDPDGKPFQLTQAKIRGVDSFGMICSEYELELGEDKSGILVLPENVVPGISLSEYLGLDDVVLDIAITPNRADCLSHIGIAREVGAILKCRLRKPKPKVKESRNLITLSTKIFVEDIEKCPRYTARVIKNVNVRESPKWLQNYLTAVGIRPINNIVDITNFVLMEIGHPLHAFDYDKLADHTIRVRTAKEGEYFTTLDGRGRELKDGMLLICDAEKPIAIAGVMGGINSEISDTTRNVLLESAYFSPTSIRKTSKTLGLFTDASQRFERGADPNITIYAIDRATELIQNLTNAEVLLGRIDIYPKKISPRKIPISSKKTNQILGTNLSVATIKNILQRLEIKINKRYGERLIVQVPTFRTDLEREIDLIEEIARSYGYDRIENKQESLIKFLNKPLKKDLHETIRNWLTARGYFEIVTNSLQKKEIASLASSDFVEILNPISREMAAMRTSMLPTVLEVIRKNIFHQQKDLNLFEIGRVYFRDETVKQLQHSTAGFREENRLILAKTGISEKIHWSKSERLTDIFDVKGDLEDLLVMCSLDNYKFISYSSTETLTEMTLSINLQNNQLGYIGKVRSELIKQFDIEQDVYVADINLDILESFLNYNKKYVILPEFPKVIRDLAFIVDKKVSVEVLLQTISSISGNLLKYLDIFDIYTGENIGKDKKSIAFTLEFQSEKKTLTDQEVDIIIENIVKVMNQLHGATLRK